ncbi:MULTISPECIES: AzlD domain-containing protein [unclassified Massilia]|uniref:AzlD domain-containing protein n=1 Tax=unclassified Massilia TaxID=2609279 RepID=UPI001B81E49A|nr:MULTISPECIES: AzlD domain-containing protein [unclassified Massilia]MBQ5939338.1 AzlD domain-containing protein [Massilia sp. AB1]MBQ5961418.1 AzlD domain-containing protein [Massilia sp. ZL223]
MADWEIWVVIGVLCVATFATRSSFWLIGHRITIPPRVQEMLRYAPACALAAIIAPDILIDAQGQTELEWTNPKLLAGLAALGFYLWRRNMLLTIIFGMAVFTLLRVLHIFGPVA